MFDMEALALFEYRMTIAGLSIILFNPIVTLFGVPVLLAYYKYSRSNKQFPFAAIYIAFSTALALQYALYWGECTCISRHRNKPLALTPGVKSGAALAPRSLAKNLGALARGLGRTRYDRLTEDARQVPDESQVL
jgi:hypothetical protein